MDIRLTSNPAARPAYHAAQPQPVKAEQSTQPSILPNRDVVEISPEARSAFRLGTAQAFREIEAIYKALGFKDTRPISAFVQADRLGHSDGMDFPNCCVEFDKLLRRDSHATGRIAGVDMEANQCVRDQIDQSVQTLFARNGVQVPEDCSFRLTVEAPDYHIRATRLNDPELAGRIEAALNRGDNGRNLYLHIQYCDPSRYGFEKAELLGLDYVGGHLLDAGTQYGYGPGQTGWQDWMRVNPVEAERNYMLQAEKSVRDIEWLEMD